MVAASDIVPSTIVLTLHNAFSPIDQTAELSPAVCTSWMWGLYGRSNVAGGGWERRFCEGERAIAVIGLLGEVGAQG